jgi:hypothetical protein
MKFQLKGEYVYLNSIRLTSDTVTLVGDGDVNLDKTINMTFYSVVGRDEWRIPLLSDLAGGASQQFLEIAVKGTLDNPTVEKKILPAVKESIDRLLADLQPALSPSPAGASPGRNRPPNR